MGQYDVIAYDASGNRLDEGDVVTSSLGSVYVSNGIVRYYPCNATGPEGHLDRWDGSVYTRALDASRGDGAFFVTPNANPPDRITVVRCSIDEIELAAEWDAWDFNTGYLGTPGVGYRDFNNPGPGLNYEESTSTPKYITESRVVKLCVMKRGREGVFLGWHSDPHVGPFDCQIPEYLNDTSWGEQEFQLGVGIQVSFASSGWSAQHPSWGADATWGALYPTQRHFWYGIDDPNYPPYDAVAYVALQTSGFPAEQTTGPWWFAGVHNLNATTYPFCVYAITRDKREAGAFQFSSGAYAQPTLHFAFRGHDAANIPHRTICFIGAFPYTSAALASEPTAALRAMVANRANDDFELSGQAELDPETTTIAAVRETMSTALVDADPIVITNRRYSPHREESDFRAFCETTPSAAFRRFSIRDTFESEGPFVSSADYREMHTTLECQVAYPKQGSYRDETAGRPLLDMHDVIRSDLHVIRTTIGVRGYMALERDGINAAVTGEDWTVDVGEACVYSVLRLRTMYREDPL